MQVVKFYNCPEALVLTHTREVALQVYKAAVILTENTGLKLVLSMEAWSQGSSAEDFGKDATFWSRL